MSYVKCLTCKQCNNQYPIDPINVCELCFGPLEVSYDYEKISRSVTRSSISNGPLNIWRYHQFLPVSLENAIDIGTGFTPLIHAKNLGALLGLKNLYIKNDSVNPSYSFKDRPVAVTTAKALEFDFKILACVSTGNLMGSVGAHAAKAKMKSYVFFPKGLEKGKIIGSSIYGARLISVDGNYDEVNRLCSELADNFKWAFVNINMRAYYAEGSKTLGFEVAEQLNWKAPAHCVVPAASGELHTKIWKGLMEMKDVGLIEKVNTKMHLAQPEGCSPIVKAFNNKETQVTPIKPNTIAKSLAIGNPASGPFALKTLKDSSGSAIAAPEEEISECIQLLAETEGIFTETAGGVVISSLRSLVKKNKINSEDITVAFITGNGLKTQEIVEDTVEYDEIKPTYKSFEEIIKI